MLQVDFGDVEDMIRDYRIQLEGYQVALSSQLQEKGKEILNIQGKM